MNEARHAAAPAADPVVLRAEGLTKIFKDFWGRPRVWAVNGIRFALRPGEVFGLLGPNGSGKSTTIKLILGLLHPTAGRIEVFGSSPRDVRTKARIGYMPEESLLYPYLTAEETLDFYGRLFPLAAEERRRRVHELLVMVGLSASRRRTIGEYSRGMSRRVGLAQALLNDPDLLLLDEPTSGLDPVACRQVKDLMLAVARRGKTVLVSSHRLADMEDVCDRVMILHGGSVCAEGPTRGLLQQTDRCRITLPPLPPERLAAVADWIRRETGAEPGIEHPAQTLEQYFISIVTGARRQGVAVSPPEPPGIAPFLAASARPPEDS
jgi:ABC-2 type transport system ATP-binding protein